MRARSSSLVLLFSLLFAGAPVADAHRFEPRSLYRLTNDFLGPARSLDTYSDGENRPFMADTSDAAGQVWMLTPLRDGTYRLTNLYLGTARSLDVSGDGEQRLVMASTGRRAGQHWTLTSNGDGSLRITNAYLGSARALDTYGGDRNDPFMGPTDRDYSGQHWRLVPVHR